MSDGRGKSALERQGILSPGSGRAWIHPWSGEASMSLSTSRQAGLGALAILVFWTSATARAAAPDVPRYGVFEQSFSWGNGGQVQLTATFTAPSGGKSTAGGFYDGG